MVCAILAEVTIWGREILPTIPIPLKSEKVTIRRGVGRLHLYIGIYTPECSGNVVLYKDLEDLSW